MKLSDLKKLTDECEIDEGREHADIEMSKAGFDFYLAARTMIPKLIAVAEASERAFNKTTKKLTPEHWLVEEEARWDVQHTLEQLESE